MRTFEGFMHGINLGGWLSQCVSYDKKHFDTFITEENIKQIAGWGLDHVRVPVDYDVMITDDGIWKEEGLSHLYDVISWCKTYHLNMVLDLHKTKGYMFDKDAVANPDLFFQQKDLQDFFVMIWKEFATRFGNESDMLAFELLNEIVNPDYAKVWNDIALRAIREIRAVAPESYILVGGVNYNNVRSIPQILMPMDDKIVYNFHCYEPMCFTHQKAHWMPEMTENCEYTPCPELFDELFDEAVSVCEERNVPLYCGEYGVIDQAPTAGSLEWIKDISAAFDKYQIGRSLWNYKDKDFGLIGEHYASIMKEMIKRL